MNIMCVRQQNENRCNLFLCLQRKERRGMQNHHYHLLAKIVCVRVCVYPGRCVYVI